MTTQALPRTSETVDTDRIVHLVCDCQFDGDQPRFPMLSLCGSTVNDEDRQVWIVDRPCTMCVDQPYCPACGGWH